MGQSDVVRTPAAAPLLGDVQMLEEVALGLIVQLGLLIEFGRLALLRIGLWHRFLARQGCTGGSECRDLDDVAPVHHVREPEAPANQAAIAKQGPDLVGQGVGGHVEVLGMTPEHDIAHAPADQKCLKSGLFEPVQDAQCVAGDIRAGDVVVGTSDDAWRSADRDGGEILVQIIIPA